MGKKKSKQKNNKKRAEAQAAGLATQEAEAVEDPDALPLGSRGQQILRIVRNTGYALFAWSIVVCVINLIPSNFFQLMNLGVTSWNNLLPVIIFTAAAALAGKLFYGGKRFRTEVTKEPTHRWLRICGIVCAGIVSCLAFTCSIFIYSPTSTMANMDTMILFLNFIGLVCSALNTCVQVNYSDELLSPTSDETTSEMVTQLSTVWNMLNMWGLLLVISEMVFA